MNTSIIKYKDLALRVIYYTKHRQLGSKIFLANTKFQEVLLYFERNLKDSQTFLKSSYFLNGKQIFPNDILLYFCTVDPNLRLIEEDLFVEIEELEHIDDSSEPIYEKLLKPLVNPFKLILLNVKEGILQMVDFQKDKIKEFGFDCLVNNNFASCNSPDALYISFEKNFWIISNKNFAIEKKEMPISKEKHSMSYLLFNNTIFIAGGNNEDSFYYDINSKEFILWGKMNGIQERPALINYGDFLYSFNSFNSSGIYFERTKLSSPSKKWEKLIPQSGDQESGFFYNKLYGVSKCSGGNILFAGGINNQLRTFVYNLKLNVLYININKDESVLLNERTFYKIDHNFNIAITQNIEKDHIIAIVNKNSKSLNLLPFEQIGNKTRNNLLQYDNPRNRLPGNLIIQCRYMSLKDYENFLKQREAQKKKINNIGKNGKKNLGDEPLKFQFRNKTPSALERISEGRSEEENDESEFSRNKSSSAKKNNRKLELGLNDVNIQKFNLLKQNIENTCDKKDIKENKKNDDNKTNELNKEKNKEKNEINANNDTKINLEKKDLVNNNVNKKVGLAKNEIISKSERLISNLKEEKILIKNKNGSKKNINNNIINNETNNEQKNDESNIQRNNIIKVNDAKLENIKELNIKPENKNENKEKISKDNKKVNNNTKANIPKKSNSKRNISQISNDTDTKVIDNSNSQQNNNIIKTNNINNNSEQKKIISIQKANNVNNTQKSNQNQTTQIKRTNINNASSGTLQKSTQNVNSPFIDNSKYQNISEMESFHIKNKTEIINKVQTSSNKTMSTVQHKKINSSKFPLVNLLENKILTDPNIINTTKANTYKSNTFAQAKGNSSHEEQKNVKTINTYKVKININQDQKKYPQSKTQKINNNNENNTNVVYNNTSNTSIRIIKAGNTQQNTTNNYNSANNNDINKDGKSYNTTRVVQRLRKED